MGGLPGSLVTRTIILSLLYLLFIVICKIYYSLVEYIGIVSTVSVNILRDCKYS